MLNAIYPERDAVSTVIFPVKCKDDVVFHIVLPDLKNEYKALKISTGEWYYEHCASSDLNVYDFVLPETDEEVKKYEHTGHNKEIFNLGGWCNYIRLPENVEEYTVLHVVVNASVRAARIEFVRNEEKISFGDTDIYDERDGVTIDYYGDDDYWKPVYATRYIVEGHPNCDYGDCNYSCQVVSCGIQQGYSSAYPQAIEFIRTTIYDNK